MCRRRHQRGRKSDWCVLTISAHQEGIWDDRNGAGKSPSSSRGRKRRSFAPAKFSLAEPEACHRAGDQLRQHDDDRVELFRLFRKKPEREACFWTCGRSYQTRSLGPIRVGGKSEHLRLRLERGRHHPDEWLHHDHRSELEGCRRQWFLRSSFFLFMCTLL